MNYRDEISVVLSDGNKDYLTEMSLIEGYVKSYRIENKIIPTPERKIEFSCFAFGEGYNLLYRQLTTTTIGEGSWNELDYAPNRELVLNQILKDLLSF
jgi:hypothetical protein